MVHKPAPNSYRLKEDRSHWTNRFLEASTPRSPKPLVPLIGTLMLCIVIPSGVFSGLEKPGRASEDRPTGEQKAQNDQVVQNTAESQLNAATSTPGIDTPTIAAPATESSVSTETSKTETVPANSLPSEATAAPTVPSIPTFIAPLVARPTSEREQNLSLTAIVSGKTIKKAVAVPSSGATVGQALKSMGISLGSLDRVSPLASAQAYNGMRVRVTRVSAKLAKRFEVITSETRYQPTNTLARGSKRTVQAGQAGQIEIKERVWSVDGKVSKREFVSRRVARAARPTVIALGAKSYYLPGRVTYHKRYAKAYALSARGGLGRDRMLHQEPEGKTFRATKYFDMVATGYTSDPRENGGYVTTATGLPAGYGAAAVDTRLIPLGTKLYVEGYGYAFACDVGGAIKGRRIDLCFDSRRAAMSHGRAKRRVWILQ
jgi:3D (Asp-Asp-Asp) domain-containing protein